MSYVRLIISPVEFFGGFRWFISFLEFFRIGGSGFFLFFRKSEVRFIVENSVSRFQFRNLCGRFAFKDFFLRGGELIVRFFRKSLFNFCFGDFIVRDF